MSRHEMTLPWGEVLSITSMTIDREPVIRYETHTLRCDATVAKARRLSAILAHYIEVGKAMSLEDLFTEAGLEYTLTPS